MSYEGEYGKLWQGYDSTELTERDLQDQLKRIYGTGAITSLMLSDGSVLSSKLAKASVIGYLHIRDASITAATIQTAAIRTAHIEDLNVTRAKIDNAAIDNAKIEDLAVTTAKIRDAQISTAKIQDLAVTRAKLVDAIIGTAQIEDATITTAKIGLAQITEALIKDAAITRAKIEDAAITSAKIEDAAITTAKIEVGAITSALIDEGAIGTVQIADGSITDAKIVELTANKLTAGTIDGSLITVTNLVADNIVTGTLKIATANLVYNGGFTTSEGLYANIPDNWNYAEIINEAGVGNVFKTFSDSVGPTSGTTFRTKWTSVEPGRDITFQSWVRTEGGALGNFEAIATIEFFLGTDRPEDGVNVSISDRALLTLAPYYGVVKTFGDYSLYARTSVVPDNCNYMRVTYSHSYKQSGFNLYRTKVMASYGILVPEFQPHTNELLAQNGIENHHLGDSSVDGRAISPNSITSDKIVTGSVTAEKIAAKSITANEIMANTITAASGILADASITTAKIADAAITSAKIISLDADKINADQLSAITANLGTVTSGYILGAEIRSSVSDPNAQINETYISNGYARSQRIIDDPANPTTRLSDLKAIISYGKFEAVSTITEKSTGFTVSTDRTFYQANGIDKATGEDLYFFAPNNKHINASLKGTGEFRVFGSTAGIGTNDYALRMGRLGTSATFIDSVDHIDIGRSGKRIRLKGPIEAPELIKPITPWTSISLTVGYKNGWYNYGGEYKYGEYMKDAFGWVHLTGLVRGGSVSTDIFQLPTGHRPSATLGFSCASHSPVSARVYALTDGNIRVTTEPGSWVFLDGISFYAGN